MSSSDEAVRTALALLEEHGASVSEVDGTFVAELSRGTAVRLVLTPRANDVLVHFETTIDAVALARVSEQLRGMIEQFLAGQVQN